MDFVSSLKHFPGTKSGSWRQIYLQISAPNLVSYVALGYLFKL